MQTNMKDNWRLQIGAFCLKMEIIHTEYAYRPIFMKGNRSTRDGHRANTSTGGGGQMYSIGKNSAGRNYGRRSQSTFSSQAQYNTMPYLLTVLEDNACLKCTNRGTEKISGREAF